MKKRLKRSFYAKPTLRVAKDLLGKHIVRKIGKRKLIGKILETEAYIGPKDRASHARNNKITERNRAEYLVGGHIYIYLVYGMYWQFNISTYQAGLPECVLVRAIEIPEAKISLSNGPGKLCRCLKLDKSFYGEDLTKSKRIWLEDWGEKLSPLQILSTPRIGIDYAGPYWAKKKLRFLIKDYRKHLPNHRKTNFIVAK
ncbi:DNA-3-methyladenine glycosylase [Patescibacteria group bacterium]|nr:DNA-3-methyladenine glycosylase [Patescibacteria group bacterium]